MRAMPKPTASAWTAMSLLPSTSVAGLIGRSTTAWGWISIPHFSRTLKPLTDSPCRIGTEAFVNSGSNMELSVAKSARRLAAPLANLASRMSGSPMVTRTPQPIAKAPASAWLPHWMPFSKPRFPPGSISTRSSRSYLVLGLKVTSSARTSFTSPTLFRERSC